MDYYVEEKLHVTNKEKSIAKKSYNINVSKQKSSIIN